MNSDKIAPPEFVAWLNNQIDQSRFESDRQFALYAGISPTTLHNTTRSNGRPSFDTCIAIARLLRIDPIDILRRAELLPPAEETPPDVEDAIYKLKTAPQHLRDHITKYVNWITDPESDNLPEPPTA